MKMAFAYLVRSTLASQGAGTDQLLSFAPNLTREPVSFDAALKQPLRFREAISSLHDVVINDLRFHPRDKTAYEVWKKNETLRLAALRSETYRQAKAEVLVRQANIPPDLERQYNQKLKVYWKARQRYSDYLRANDVELWRRLMPCDPVITVADDVVFFECFSADESSYGCLSVNRDEAFGPCQQLRLGTTNVDYSWDLYNQFQLLRTYHPTRFRVDPAGFDVAVAGRADLREEKIDLPDGWLRGFMATQQAMALPMTKVTLSREAVYSLLVWLKRHKARTSPRAIRFELIDGRPPAMVLEPWGTRIESVSTKYEGPPTEPIRIWGRQRLLVLSRILPLAERIDVFLLGTGLPSFWVAQLGEMRLTLGLSGWTTNDWTRGSALDLVLPPAEPSPELVARVAAVLRERRAMTFAQVTQAVGGGPADVLAALGKLAHSGQVIHDLHARVYRFRQIMPQALGEAQLGGDSPELAEGKKLLAAQRVRNVKVQELSAGARLVTSDVDHQKPEILIDGDGRIKRGKCACSYYFKYSFRNGPCRHMVATHRLVMGIASAATEASTNQANSPAMNSWFNRWKERLGVN